MDAFTCIRNLINIEEYYTTELEELHMGFDVELNYGAEWMPYTMNRGSFIDWVDERRNPEAWIRVKYLDREDIASLGFEHLGSGWFKKGNCRVRKWVQQQVDIYLWEEDEHHNEGDIIFRGDIKNKSELKQILTQLNIN